MSVNGYKPLKIVGPTTGLVQEREEYLLPDDAYPVLENAYVWREQIKRKLGFEGLQRLRRKFSSVSLGNSVAVTWSFNLFSTVSPAIPKGSTEPLAQIEPGSLVISLNAGAVILTDQGDGTLTSPTPATSGTVNYITGAIVVHDALGIVAVTASFNYFPGLPVMGLRNRDIQTVNNQLTIAFDTTYAYINSGGLGWQEYIPGTTWTGNDINFFWSTNYFVDASFLRLFWVTNFSGTGGDPIRYTNGSTWTDFSPKINVAGDVLAQCLCILPFRNRLLVFNTYEGVNLATSIQYPQRIRWSAISSPLLADSWLDDKRGKGGFIDIPTNEAIVSVGSLRDNIVIYCSRSTWQLRYTGRTIAPFQLEKVNTELGAEGTFSTVQFDTYFVGVGDKGIVMCDTFKSERIDVKIPNLVFQFNDTVIGSQVFSGAQRIQAIRDYVNKLAFFTYAYQPGISYPIIYPNRRLVYNYENDSWGIFTDSLTSLGTFYPSAAQTWENTSIPWDQAIFPWFETRQISTPSTIGGNQLGFIFYLDSKVSNDPSLMILGITGHTTTATEISCPNHNLSDGDVIQISGITSTGYASLNGKIFGIFSSFDKDKFYIYTYNPVTDDFDLPQLNAAATYNGGGVIAVRDNFWIQSKKFNYVDTGKSIQMGYVDLLMDTTENGAITLQVYANYNDDQPVNTTPANQDPVTLLPDTFFNSIIKTAKINPTGVVGSKYWQRVFCASRGNFLTLVYTLSNAQMVGVEQQSEVQINAQILWQREAGRMTQR